VDVRPSILRRDRQGLQRTGNGSLLLDDAEAQAQASGSDRPALDVAVGNDGAKRLCERRGSAVVARSRPVRVMGGTAVERMAKDL
jgi:hypothetical protein